MRTLDSRLDALSKRVVKINPIGQPGWEAKVSLACPDMEIAWDRVIEIAMREGIESERAFFQSYCEGHPELRPLLDEITEYICVWAEKQEPRLNFRGHKQDMWRLD